MEELPWISELRYGPQELENRLISKEVVESTDSIVQVLARVRSWALLEVRATLE